MSISATRVWAIIRKELRDYRRNRFIVSTMALTPVLFVALPIVDIFTLPAARLSAQLDKRIGLSLFYMLLIPALVPAALAAYAVVGEREQGTLEPVLTTPVRREEFLLGKAVAILVPTVAVSYVGFGIFLACVGLFAHPTVAAAVFRGPEVLAQLLFTPLLAGWAIWAGIAISARSSDVRVAQQLGILASLPPLAVTSLLSFGVIQPTLALALGLAAALLAIDAVGWRLVSVLFDRERLVTGGRS
jgi:ABC-2 type transport system permease protein